MVFSKNLEGPGHYCEHHVAKKISPLTALSLQNYRYDTKIQIEFFAPKHRKKVAVVNDVGTFFIFQPSPGLNFPPLFNVSCCHM